jgi:hypothetical protein
MNSRNEEVTEPKSQINFSFWGEFIKSNLHDLKQKTLSSGNLYGYFLGRKYLAGDSIPEIFRKLGWQEVKRTNKDRWSKCDDMEKFGQFSRSAAIYVFH